MKAIIIGDSHVYYGDQRKNIKNMMSLIKKETPDIILNLGDTGEIMLSNDTTLIEKLFSIQPHLFLLGNHCLYGQQDLNPIEAMDAALKKFRWGTPLQRNWCDTTTTYEKDGVLFLGVIGWPDFGGPNLPYPKTYYDCRFSATIDSSYINLRQGWLKYTQPMLDAFDIKLQLINNSKCNKVIIITHYPIFTSQYKLNVNEEISNYFFCNTLGEMVKYAAQINPNKKIWAIAGHGHNYCTGQWFDLTNNLTTFGFVTDYDIQRFEILDI